MKIEFLNLNETELEELRILEKENFDHCILSIAREGFDGVADASLIMDVVQTAVSVISLILAWKERRTKNLKECNSNGNAAKEVEIVIVHNPNNTKTILLSEATECDLRIELHQCQ